MDGQTEHWRSDLWSGDAGTCFGAWCCPCFMFGRGAERLEKFPDSDEKNFSWFNGSCAVMCLSGCVHLNWLVLMLKRSEMRQRFNIPGDACSDCLVSYFCHCCTISQLDMEMKMRSKAVQMGEAAPGYTQQQQGMVYKPAA